MDNNEPVKNGAHTNIVPNLLWAVTWGVATFCACAILGIILAFATNVIRPGICGLTDGPNAGSYWAYMLLCFPFIISIAVTIWSYDWHRKRRNTPDIEEIEPSDT